MRRFFTLFIMLIFSGVLASAQNRISGQVRDAAGNPVPFASVTEKGSKKATTADASGNFTINSKQTSTTLVVTGVGYAMQEVDATGTNVSITMSRSTQELAAVVVTGLGIQRQAKELGYSTAKVSAPELTQGKVVNLQNGLTGKVSGLNIQTVNNGVFADTRITLRGIRSLTGNNQPMLILDGVPVGLSFISSINPNDIANVTILKSASSTAIYGPEGVNGAIVITTKRGSKQNPIITLSHTIQLEKVTFMPRFQSQFGSGSSETPDYVGVYDPIENQGYGPAFTGGDSVVGRVGPDGNQQHVTYEARPQEKKNFWSTGVTNQTDFSIATGDFYLSFQHVDIKGIVPKDENKRNSVHMTSSKDLGTKLKAAFTLQYTRSDYNVNAGSDFGNGRDYSPYWNLINTPMQIPITKYKNWKTDYYSSPDGFYNDYYYNPYWAIDNFRKNGRKDDVLGNLQFDYKLSPAINLTYRLSATYSNETYKETQGALTYGVFAKESGKSNAQTGDLPSAVIDAQNTNNRLTSELFGTFRKDYGKFKFEALLGQSYREINVNNNNNFSPKLGIPVFNSSVRSAEVQPSAYISKERLERFFGQVSVGFNNWAFVQFTGSNDIDSRLVNPYAFDYDNISFFYPGVNASIVLSEAIPSIKNGSVFSYAKIRGAISKTGNVNLNPYSLENTYSQTNGFPYGSVLGFSSDNTLRQSSYQPEFVKNKEVGLELGFVKNRINFEATAYTQDNSNQIITVNYSGATGYPQASLNAANFTNKGLEFDLKLTPLIKIRKLSMDFKVNYTYQENKVTGLVNGVNELGIGNGNFLIVGQPAYTFKLTDYERDDQGRVKVDQFSGYPKVSTTTKQFGQTLPKNILGLNLNVNFKGVSLSAVADYRNGNEIYSDIGADMDFSGISYRSGQNGRQPFIFPNSSYSTDGGKTYVANTSIYTQDGGYNFWSQARNTGANSNYLSSAAFWKLRELALTYTFPATMFSKKGLKGAAISLTGRNLATWLPKTNEWTDPEFSNTTGNAQGVNDRDNTPPTRLFGANITLQF